MSGTRVNRLLQLINALRSGQAYTADELARQLHISRRTVFRDLQMLERSGVPCRYDPNRRGYQVDEWYFLPPVSLSAPEALALYIAAAKIATDRTFPLHAESARAVEKVLQSLPAGLRNLCLRMGEMVEVRWPAMVDTAAIRQTFQKLQDAAAACRKVRLGYDSYYEKCEITVVLHPYVQALLNRAWYVIGYCETHRQVRIFNLDRIVAADLMDETFVRPGDFSLDEHFGKAWSMIREGKVHAVRLRFLPKVAGNVEEIIWHLTQRTERTADGSLILEVDVDGLTEISWWIMGYGDQVIVEKPAELRNRIIQMAQGILKQYGERFSRS